MNAFYIVYNLLSTGLGMALLPPLWWSAMGNPQRKKALIQRLGYPSRQPSGSLGGKPKIWIHAVSVGEVKAAETIVNALGGTAGRPRILLTTTTRTGQQYACNRFGPDTVVRYAPIDLWSAVNRFFRGYRPDLLICMETEIWPNWLFMAHRLGIPTVFLNGRISTRSIRAYSLIKPLVRPMLETVSAFSMISDADARRIIAMGAPAGRVQVNGNAKMDTVLPRRPGEVIAAYRKLFAIRRESPVMVAGSVRGGELKLMLDVYRRLAEKISGLVFILAPRHPENTERIKSLAASAGIHSQCRSDLSDSRRRNASLIILDTIGELRHIYAVASVVFCGASLVPLGGQDILEPAMWAKPVLYGPFMEDFEAARRLLESAGGGIRVRDADELVRQSARLLTHHDEARRMGRRAFDALVSSQGAAARHAMVIRGLLTGRV